jgi:hypothetical protein
MRNDLRSKILVPLSSQYLTTEVATTVLIMQNILYISGNDSIVNCIELRNGTNRSVARNKKLTLLQRHIVEANGVLNLTFNQLLLPPASSYT